MNRKIKFRAKILQTGEWFYWSLKDMIGPHDIREDIDWNTVGQYTGLKDKNRKEIYEGDILENKEKGCFAEIIWTNDVASKTGLVKGMFGDMVDLSGFMTTLGQFEFRQFGRKTSRSYHLQDLEIIGDFYSNPELIK